jgi:hypothetical protein
MTVVEQGSFSAYPHNLSNDGLLRKLKETDFRPSCVAMEKRTRNIMSGEGATDIQNNHNMQMPSHHVSIAGGRGG